MPRRRPATPQAPASSGGVAMMAETFQLLERCQTVVVLCAPGVKSCAKVVYTLRLQPGLDTRSAQLRPGFR